MLAGTQTLLESREDFFTGNGQYPSRLYVVDALANLFFPFVTEIESVQTCSYGFDQVSTLARRQRERRLENLVRLSHHWDSSSKRGKEHPSR